MHRVGLERLDPLGHPLVEHPAGKVGRHQPHAGVLKVDADEHVPRRVDAEEVGRTTAGGLRPPARCAPNAPSTKSWTARRSVGRLTPVAAPSSASDIGRASRWVTIDLGVSMAGVASATIPNGVGDGGRGGALDIL